jgi:SNF2 family DNA or RNA helicase
MGRIEPLKALSALPVREATKIDSSPMIRLATAVAEGLTKFAKLKSSVELQPHQQRAMNKLNKQPGLLLYHGLGSGKTLSSIAAAEDAGGRKTNVVVPAALRENYKKELHKFIGKVPSRYHIGSYEQAVKHGFKPADLTVFDESQRMGHSESSRSALARQAPGKKLFLSGTPVRNEPAEILPLLQGLSPDRNPPQTTKAFNERFINEAKVTPNFWGQLKGAKPGIERTLKNQSELSRLFRDRVDYHASAGEFPTTSHVQHTVPMSEPQTTLYRGMTEKNPVLAYKIRKNLPPSKLESQQLNAFLSGVRQISNDPATFDTELAKLPPSVRSPKIRAMVGRISKEHSNRPNYRALVYSNYLKAGVEPVAQELKSAGISVGVYTGKQSDKQKKQLVDDYNSGVTSVLLISGAGAEGLDLKGTSAVHIMEPHFNQARIKQVIGRAVRHKSHAHLPEKERHVKVEYYSTEPENKPRMFGLLGPKREQGADAYLQGLSDKKEKLNQELMRILQDEGSR